MPQTCQILPVTRVEVIREAPGYFSNLFQMILKPVPIFGWFPISGRDLISLGVNHFIDL